MADKLIETARKRFRLAVDALGNSRQSELDDLKFAAASPDNQWQWPQDVLATRGAVQGQTTNARPCLTVNKLPQHIKQVTNDQRQNRPSAKVIPADDKADVKVAEMLEGVVRHIEYISDADVSYDTACENQVTYGEGYIRVLTEYCDDMSMDQDIKIGRIRNSFSVYMDPSIQDPCGADAQWCFISQEMSKDEFRNQFPGKEPVSMVDVGTGDPEYRDWLIDDDSVRVAEYFYYETTKKTLIQYANGAVVVKGSKEEQDLLTQAIPPMLKDGKPVTRETEIKKVKWCKINGFQVLETNEWAGKYIPIIRVVGNEFEIEGRLYVSGLVRNAKDAQRMYNYWSSQEVEMLALAPKAPFIGYGGQFQGYETQWKSANIQNWPYLEVNGDVTDQAGNPLPLPQRAMPPMPQTAIIQAKMGAADDIKSVTGQYDASLGAESNEKSGRAILARERQTDTGTYHYVDNLARAIRHCGRQIIDLIPKIYDTARIARIVGLDGEIDRVKIDPTMQEPIREIQDEETGAVIERIYNPSVGKYDVCVTTGPSYMTKRQQAAEAQAQILQGNPELWKVAGDLFVKNLDWPGADELAKRLAKIVPAEIRDDQDESPEMAQAKQMMQGMQQEIEQLQGTLQNVGKSIEYQDAANAHMVNEINIYKAETDRMKALAPTMNPEDIQALVMKTVSEAMANPPLESEESGFMEEQEPAHMQEQPEMPQGVM